MVKKYTEDEGPPPLAGGAYPSWAFGSGRAAYFMLSGKVQQVPVLVELSGVTIEEFASGESFFDDEKLVPVWQSAVRVAKLFHERPEPLKAINFVTAFVSEAFFKLRNDPQHKGLQQAVPLVMLGPPLPETCLPNALSSSGATSAGPELAEENVPQGEAELPLLSADATGEAGPVVTGIIDDGIAFANERFRNGKQTRIQYLWIQDNVLPSLFFPSGRELNAAEINTLLAGSTYLQAPASSPDWVDEDQLYQKAGVLDYSKPGHKSLGLRATHGAAVMDTAAGYPADPGRDDRPIIAVQLPTDVVADTSLEGLAPFLFAGCFYTLVRSLDVAQKLGTGPLRVVINVSFGNIAGPHDGTSPLERALDVLLHLWRTFFAPVQIVLPAGNSYLSRTHAQFGFPTDDSDNPNRMVLPWRVQPDDKTASHMQVWLPHQAGPIAGDRVRLRVIAPGGSAPTNATPWLGETNGAKERYPLSGDVWCEVHYTFMPLPTARGVFQIFLQPTARFDFNASGSIGPIAPSGIWTVEIENLQLAPDQLVDAWIQRDDTPFTYPPFGRQSYFDDPCYQRFDAQGREIEVDDPNCFIKRLGTLNAIATGSQPVVIGGFLRKELKPANYSSAGPATIAADGTLSREGPDALAVSEDSIVHAGVLAAGTRSASVIAIGGTSIATPRITRWIANQMAAGNAGDRNAVSTLASNSEAGPPPLPDKPPVERGGAGRILLKPVYRSLARFWPWP